MTFTFSFIFITIDQFFIKKNDFVGTLGVSKKGKYTFLTFKRYHLAFKYFQNFVNVNEIALS